MESVMNFLAENYIWFFIAAGVLLFALIGFLIEGKSKNKSEFKGESIEKEDKAVETPVSAPVEPKAEEILDLDNAPAPAPVMEEAPKEETPAPAPETTAAPEAVVMPAPEAAPAVNETPVVTEEAKPELEIIETPTLEEAPVNPELEGLSGEPITLGELPQMPKEDK